MIFEYRGYDLEVNGHSSFVDIHRDFTRRLARVDVSYEGDLRCNLTEARKLIDAWIEKESDARVFWEALESVDR